MKYIVQAWCTGLGWTSTRHGGNNCVEAEIAEDNLRADDSAWMNGSVDRNTRIIIDTVEVVSKRY